MRAFRWTRFAVFILLVSYSAGFAQEEARGYFSLDSSRTYAPGQKVAISLWAQNVDTLEFRVYRVNDPVKFFVQLGNAHQFGGHVPAPPRKLTWLEQFHNWKHRSFAWIRDFFRSQFTAENRETIRQDRSEAKQQPQTAADVFAQIPILNSQQLVATWRQNVLSRSYRWETENVAIPVKDRGLYLIEATDGKLRAYTIVIVSQMALITKTAPGTVLTFAADRQTSQPIPGARTLFFVNRDQVGEQLTDQNGLAEIDVKEPRPENIQVMARTDGDFAVSTPWSYWMNTDLAHSLTTYIYTDRPVYRPRDTVHFKAILRSRAGFNYQAPANTDFNLKITDLEGKDVFTATLRSSAMGTLHGEYAIPANAALGDYNIQVRTGDSFMEGGSFAVQEYKKPEYEVRIIPDSPRVTQGQPIRATIEAKYYFGEPVANAKVTWVVHRERTYDGLYVYSEEEGEDGEYGDEGEGEAEGSDTERYYNGEQTEESSATLNERGQLQITIPTDFTESNHSDTTYRIEARVTDEGNREISGHNYVLATYSSFRIGAWPASYLYEVGSTAKLQVEARDYDQHPVQTTFHVALQSWDYRSHTGEDFFSSDGQTDASGNAEVEVPIKKGGSIHATVTAVTPEKRTLQETAYIWVPDKEWYWWGGDQERIQIIPDQKAYKPGDTAKVVIMAGPNPVSILVTSEGVGLLNRQVVRSQGGPVMVEVPVRAENAPNFYLTATFLKDDKLHRGSKSLAVPADALKLNVQLQPSKAQFEPGEAASYTLVAKDAQGKPVTAEFSLGVVDEAVYAIRPEATTDIVKFFYGRVFNHVTTDSSLSYYFHGEAGKKQMQLADVKVHKWLADIKPEQLVQPRVRKAFPDTAFWVADVKTGANGKASVRFNFPDSLTTWRTTARGITADTKVGSAVEKVIVRKNLMVRLAVPRFFRQGDQVTISALVHNYLPAAKNARVSIDLKGLDVIDGATRDVNVPSKGEVKVDWRVKAGNVSESSILAKALTNEESDAMELTLPVIPYGVKLDLPRSGSLEGNADTNQSIDFPGQTEASGRSLQVDLSSSTAGAIVGALEYLTSYPYGCTEQTMSSFLPDVIVADAIKQLGLKPSMSPEELKKKIDAGTKRLYEYQHDDGGWGWWETDDSHVFMSAYVLAGLSQAKRIGYDVDQQRLAKAQSWVRHAFDNDQRIIADLRAYMAYSLALSGTTDKHILDSVWEQRSDLTPYGAAMLGLAMSLANDSRVAELAATVEKGTIIDDQAAYWKLTRDPMLDFETDASPEATAFAAKFLSKVNPNSALLPKAALWLVSHRDEGYWWDSTKQTAFVVYGLIDFLKQSGELKPDYSVEVLVNDKSVLTKRFTEADAFSPATATVRLGPDQLGPNNRVVIRKQGPGRLYWSLRGEYYSDEKKLTNAGSFNLTLAREYFRLSPIHEGERIRYKLERLNGPVQTGDTLAVRLTVAGSDWKYMMVEDPIPAGTEFIEHDNLYDLTEKPSWWDSWFTRREFHDDRAAFFQTYFSRGDKEYVYLLKVVNPGIFRVSPGKVEPMYQPSYFATSDPLTLEVK